MVTYYRKCRTCERNRAEKFFVSSRGKVCFDCKRAGARKIRKRARLRVTYDLSLTGYKVLLAVQGGVCAICLGKRNVYDVDHSHALAKAGTPIRQTIRGLLCARCNRHLLPAARDDAALLRRAADYLETMPAQKILTGVE